MNMQIIALAENRMYNALAQILGASPESAKRKLAWAKEFSQCVKYKYLPFFNEVDVDSLASKLVKDYGVNHEWLQTGNGTPFVAHSITDVGRITRTELACEKVYFLMDHLHFCVLVFKISDHFFLVYPKKWFLDVRGNNWDEFRQVIANTAHLPTESYFVPPSLLDDFYTGKIYPGRVEKSFDKWKSSWLDDLIRKDDTKSSTEFKQRYGPEFFEFKNTCMNSTIPQTMDA